MECLEEDVESSLGDWTVESWELDDEKSDVYLYDTRTNTVMAKPNQDGIKEKVSAVREVIGSSYSGHQIFLVLQFYEYSVEQAIQAFLEDGAKEALTEWHYHGNKPNNKKKKNKNKSKLNSGAAPAAGTSSPASTTTTTTVTTKESLPTKIINGLVDGAANGAASSSDIPELVSASEVDDRHIVNGLISAEETAMVTASLMSPSIPIIKEPVSTVTSPPSLTARHEGSSSGSHDAKSDLTHLRAPAKPVKRPATLNTSGRKQKGGHRERTVSEQSVSSVASSYSSETHKGGTHAGLQKSVRDLQRQNSSLARHKIVLAEEVEKSFKQMRKVFEEIRNALNDREADLMFEMEKVKQSATDIFSKRIQQSTRLKQSTDRAPSLSAVELAELRADIKMFVSDRKIDEELSRTSRFTCDMEHMMEEVQKFGQVVPLRCAYNQRRPSVSSVSSVVSHDDMLTPTTPSTPGFSASANSSFNSTTPMSPLAQSTVPDRTAKEAAQLQKSSLEESLKRSGDVATSAAAGHVTPAHRPHTHHPRSPQAQPASQQAANRAARSAPLSSQGQSGQSQDVDKSAPKTRNARRRQRERERKQQVRAATAQGGEGAKMKKDMSSVPPKSTPDASSSPRKSPANSSVSSPKSTQSDAAAPVQSTPKSSNPSSPAKQTSDVKAKSAAGGQQNRGGRPSSPNKRPSNRGQGSPRKSNPAPKERGQNLPQPSTGTANSSDKTDLLKETDTKVVENGYSASPKVTTQTSLVSNKQAGGDSAVAVVAPQAPNGPLVNGNGNVKKANVSVENPVLEATALPQRQGRGHRGSRQRDVKRAEVIVNGNHGNHEDEVHSIR